MDADSQARGGCGGCSEGVPNYKNDILINVVEEYLPQVLEAWRRVALAYQRVSMESTLRRGGRTFGTIGTGISATAHAEANR